LLSVVGEANHEVKKSLEAFEKLFDERERRTARFAPGRGRSRKLEEL